MQKVDSYFWWDKGNWCRASDVLTSFTFSSPFSFIFFSLSFLFTFFSLFLFRISFSFLVHLFLSYHASGFGPIQTLTISFFLSLSHSKSSPFPISLYFRTYIVDHHSSRSLPLNLSFSPSFLYLFFSISCAAKRSLAYMGPSLGRVSRPIHIIFSPRPRPPPFSLISI